MYLFIGSPSQEAADSSYNRAHELTERQQYTEAFAVFAEALKKYQSSLKQINRWLLIKPNQKLYYEKAFLLCEVALTKTRMLQDSLTSFPEFLDNYEQMVSVYRIIEQAQKILQTHQKSADVRSIETLKNSLIQIEQDLYRQELVSFASLTNLCLEAKDDFSSKFTHYDERVRFLSSQVDNPHLINKAYGALLDKMSECVLLEVEQRVSDQAGSVPLDRLQVATGYIERAIAAYTQAGAISDCIPLHLSYLMICEKKATLSSREDSSVFFTESLAYIERNQLLNVIAKPEQRVELLDGLLKALTRQQPYPQQKIRSFAIELKELCQQVMAAQPENDVAEYVTLAESLLSATAVSGVSVDDSPVTTTFADVGAALQRVGSQLFFSQKRAADNPMAMRDDTAHGLAAGRPVILDAGEVTAGDSGNNGSPKRLHCVRDGSSTTWHSTNSKTRQIQILFDNFLEKIPLSRSFVSLLFRASADGLRPDRHPAVENKSRLDVARATLYALAKSIILPDSRSFAVIDHAISSFLDEKRTSRSLLKVARVLEQVPLVDERALASHQGLSMIIKKNLSDFLVELEVWFENTPKVHSSVLQNYLRYLVQQFYCGCVPTLATTQQRLDYADFVHEFSLLATEISTSQQDVSALAMAL